MAEPGNVTASGMEVSVVHLLLVTLNDSVKLNDVPLLFEPPAR